MSISNSKQIKNFFAYIIKRLDSIANSIISEDQSIPNSYWDAVNKARDVSVELINKYNLDLILPINDLNYKLNSLDVEDYLNQLLVDVEAVSSCISSSKIEADLNIFASVLKAILDELCSLACVKVLFTNN